MAKYLHWELPPSEPNVTFHDEYMSRSKFRTLRHLLVSAFTLAPELGLVWLVVGHAVHEGHHMEVRGVLVHPELLQPAVTHVLVQDLHLLHPGHARQVLLRGEVGSVLELQTKVRKDFIITTRRKPLLYRTFSWLKASTFTNRCLHICQIYGLSQSSLFLFLTHK